MVIYFGMLFRWKNFCFCRLDWNVDKLIMRKGLSLFFLCRLSYKQICSGIGMNSIDKVCIEIFFFSFGFFVEVICCMFHQFLFRHIDGKNRSATARLDCICICLFYLYIKCRSRGKFFRFYLSLSLSLSLSFHSLFFLFFFHNYAEIEIIFFNILGAKKGFSREQVSYAWNGEVVTITSLKVPKLKSASWLKLLHSYNHEQIKKTSIKCRKFLN